MSKIAKKFGLTVDQVLAANPQIKDPNKIKIGDEIVIPVPPSDEEPGGEESRRRPDAGPRTARRALPGEKLIEVILPASTRNVASRWTVGAPGRTTSRSAS